MKLEENPLNGNWMCWVPNHIPMFAFENKRDAIRFVKRINEGLDAGESFEQLLNKRGIKNGD